MTKITEVLTVTRSFLLPREGCDGWGVAVWLLTCTSEVPGLKLGWNDDYFHDCLARAGKYQITNSMALSQQEKYTD
jgi:hypothetical protein